MDCSIMSAALACATLVVQLNPAAARERFELFDSDLKCKVDTVRVHLAFWVPRDGVAARCVRRRLRADGRSVTFADNARM